MSRKIPEILTEKQKSKKKVISDTLQKCSFCSTINAPSNSKCKNCGLSLSYQVGSQRKSEREEEIAIRYERPEFYRKLEMLTGVAGMLFILAGVLQYFFKESNFAFKYFEFVIILVPVIAWLGNILYGRLTGQNVYIQTSCRSCGMTMAVKTPSSLKDCPTHLRCWNCKTIHNITWIEPPESKATIG